MMSDSTPRPLQTQEITTSTDSREILAHARRQADERNLDDYFIVDVMGGRRSSSTSKTRSSGTTQRA